MTAVSFKDASAADKIALLGREFANIEVIEADLSADPPIVKVILNGNVINLVGDPQETLKTYLGGSGSAPETSH